MSVQEMNNAIAANQASIVIVRARIFIARCYNRDMKILAKLHRELRDLLREIDVIEEMKRDSE